MNRSLSHYSLDKLNTDIASSLAQGVCCIVFLPAGLNIYEFESTLSSCSAKEFNFEVKSVSAELTNGESPFLRLKEHLSIDEDAKYLEQLVTSKAMPDTVIVSKFDDISPQQQKQWLEALSRWAMTAKSIGGQKSLLIAMSKIPYNLEMFPVKDIRLQYYWWPGPSALEIMLMLRQNSDQIEAEDQWREYVIPSLSGSDKELALTLLDVVLQPQEVIIEKLRNYALEKGWNKEEIQKAISHWKPNRLRAFPDGNLQLWSKGLLSYTPEYGEELHSSVLALFERENEISHRLWRGQSSLILPMIDYIRFRVAEIIKNYYPNHMRQYESDDGYIDLGQLKRAIDQLPSTSSEKQQWHSVIFLAHKIRNNFAHYHPVTFEDFQKIRPKYLHLRKMAN
jgi:hypothetical protein